MAQEYTGWDDQKEYEKDEKKHRQEQKLIKQRTTTDCRTEEGITVGLIDSLITTSRVLKHRLSILQLTPAIEEALKDLKSDKDLKSIL